MHELRTGRSWIRGVAATAIVAAIGATVVSAPAAAYVCKAGFTIRSASAVVQSNALSAARTAWSAAVQTRYGISWSVWTLAQQKVQHCSQSGGVWTCNAQAKPCR